MTKVALGVGVFEVDAPDRFRLNAAAELLRRDVPGSQRAGVLFTAGDMTWQLWWTFLKAFALVTPSLSGHSARMFLNVMRRIATNLRCLARPWRHSALPCLRR